MADILPRWPLSKQLHLKPHYRLLLLNAPNDICNRLDPLPKIETTAAGSAMFDALLLFALDRAALDAQLDTALSALKPGGLFWVAYPKKSSKRQTDLSRDKGWESLWAKTYYRVELLELDRVWSALRYQTWAEIIGQ